MGYLRHLGSKDDHGQIEDRRYRRRRGRYGHWCVLAGSTHGGTRLGDDSRKKYVSSAVGSRRTKARPRAVGQARLETRACDWRCVAAPGDQGQAASGLVGWFARIYEHSVPGSDDCEKGAGSTPIICSRSGDGTVGYFALVSCA